MLSKRLGASHGVRWGVLGLATVVALLATTTDPADARGRRKAKAVRTTQAAAYQPAYAAIVLDANSGEVLHAAQADALRHPASITKIMTLYLLFERLEAGKFTLDTPLEVSAHAAAQAPSKLGLRPGQTIRVEDAIMALVTKSANDIASVVAEAIAGDEDEFAALMTRKARALGMTRTVYKNASGLPDPDQVTTARDQTLLARAVQERFPRYYRYFSRPVFVYHGRAMRNHNRLLGQVEGMDGIKTGFTRASGFNLVTSVRRGNRHIVAVVLGGRSAGARDARMRDLIGQYIVEASTRRVAPAIAEAGAPAETRAKVQVAAAGEPSAILATPRQSLTEPAGRADPAATAAIPPAAAFAARTIPGPTAASGKALNLGSTDPIKPVLVKTIPVKAGAIQSASLDPVPSANLVGSNASRMRPGAASERDAAPAARRGTLGALPASSIRHDDAATARAAEPAPRRASSDGGWMIQVGAFPGEGEAKERLQEVRSKAKNLLGAADPFTEKVIKGEKALYRARFAGLEKEQAEAACKQLKRSEIACMALKN